MYYLASHKHYTIISLSYCVYTLLAILSYHYVIRTVHTLTVEFPDVIQVVLRQLAPLSQSPQRYGVTQWLDGRLVVAREGVGVVVHDGVKVIGYVVSGAR